MHSHRSGPSQARTSDTVDFGRVPIVFIGHGFGALIVQRAMLSLDNETREDSRCTTGFLKVASLILLDAPAASPNKELFPRSTSQEAQKTWTRDWIGKQNTSRAQPQKIDVYAMWEKLSPLLLAYFVPVLWHHGSKAAATTKNFEVLLIVRQSTTSHRLSRFEGPNDRDYRVIVDTIKRSLIALCSTTKSESLAPCLTDFLRDRFPVDKRDQMGRTALHLAVKHCNPDAVKRLLYQGNASVTKKDVAGRSALNYAIQEAAQYTLKCDGVMDPLREKAYTQIIHLLIRNGARVDDRDNDGKTPWAYADGAHSRWIHRLKDKYRVFGSWSTTPIWDGAVGLPPLPEPGPQREACEAYEITFADMFLLKRRGQLSDVFNFYHASVYDAIYKGPTNVLSILENASSDGYYTQDEVRCRWIHVPANNEQWIHDLMVSIGIQDSSLRGQRHEGSRLINRYLMPQARRYKHLRGNVARGKTEPRPRPTAGQFGNPDSAASVAPGVFGSGGFPSGLSDFRGRSHPRRDRAAPSTSPAREVASVEADAIVLFMPILGFERHRHRKYLTRVFTEAENAMRKANRRDRSPDSDVRFRLQPEPVRNDDRDATVDSSADDGESSDAKLISRLYPHFPTAVAYAHADARKGRDAHLLNGYLDSGEVEPVHCRRTLDQFSYYMLGSTEARDKDQVAYRWAKHPHICPKNRPIVMVDQLWIWVLHDGTIITSFPSTWDSQAEFNLSTVLIGELQHNKYRPIIKCAEDLLQLILKTSVNFFKRKGPANLLFHECFQKAINKVSLKHSVLFNDFQQATSVLQDNSKRNPQARKSQIDTLFSVNKETELLLEIVDIQDELTIVKNILTQQHDVLQQLRRLYPKSPSENADDNVASAAANAGLGLGKDELLVLRDLVQLLKHPTTTPGAAKPSGSPDPELQSSRYEGSDDFLGPKGKEREGDMPKQTARSNASAAAAACPRNNLLQDLDLMYETISIVQNNIRVVKDMLAYAEKVENSLKSLLDLKQRHASGWEARFAREGSEESQRQGNIILVFTLVTVVFLPLSFISSFLSLEIDVFPKSEETQENLWPLADVSAYLFGISAAIFVRLILLALYVNKLIARIRHFYPQTHSAFSDPDAALDRPLSKVEPDYDSDLENTFPARSFSSSSSSFPFESDSDANGTSSHPSYLYALLFGRFTFHVYIPFVRILWRYRQYRVRDARRWHNRWEDSYVMDYPLQHFRRRIEFWILRGAIIFLAFCGSQKHKNAMERIRRRRRKLYEKRRRRGTAGGEVSSTSTSDGYSSGHEAKEVLKGDVIDKNDKLGEREKVDRKAFAWTTVEVNKKKGVVKTNFRRGSVASSLTRGTWKNPEPSNSGRGETGRSLHVVDVGGEGFMVWTALGYRAERGGRWNRRRTARRGGGGCLGSAGAM
ncbi:hypothetical protein VTJ83DRAFT_3116 [Remersonia thermophila]|uniref:Ankyrin repeat protein n=1 Tax=Remersonia thermophila TaxID=72144 RepID=A0ABR4DD75_9PEZI